MRVKAFTTKGSHWKCNSCGNSMRKSMQNCQICGKESLASVYERNGSALLDAFIAALMTAASNPPVELGHAAIARF
jgi:hypothetical protein